MRRTIPVLTLALSACATPGPSGVSVETTSQGQALAGASCVFQSGSGNWNLITPATIEAQYIVGDVRVVCDKPGYRTSELIYRATYGGYSGSSFGFGFGSSGSSGAVGFGMSVPVASGASGIPGRIIIEMNPQ